MTWQLTTSYHVTLFNTRLLLDRQVPNIVCVRRERQKHFPVIKRIETGNIVQKIILLLVVYLLDIVGLEDDALTSEHVAQC
jgi:hypothetical protein